MTQMEVLAGMLADEHAARLIEVNKAADLQRALDELGAELVADAKALKIEILPNTTHVALYRTIKKANEETHSQS